MRSRSAARAAAAISWLAIGAGIAAAQAAPSTARPKVGLALGGGGARGEAHVGVLKVLEQLHIKVDYIAGTSMGSIVGGLYASGMSTEEMEKLLTTTNWAELFQDTPPRRQLDYRRKDLDRTFPYGIEVGFSKGKPVLPPGLLAGEKLEFLLQSLTLRAGDTNDFDKLPIPFRAIATDIDTGEKIVLSKGSLPLAIRASMSLPGIFDPVVLDGRTLVDGGTVENVPVDTVRAMGADIVIAVDVGQTLEGYKTPPTNLLEVLLRLTDVPIRDNVMASRKEADILIVPDLKGYTAADFDKGAELIPRGVAAAEAKSSELSRLSVDASGYSTWLSSVRRPEGSPPRLNKVEVAEVPGMAPERLARRVKSKAGEPLNLEVLSEDLSRIYGTKLFESVSFRLEPQPDGTANLTIVPRPRAFGPDTLRAGLNASTDFSGNDFFELQASINIRELSRLGAEWRTNVEIGTNTVLNSELYWPLDAAGRFFVAPRAEYRRIVFPRPVVDVFVVDYKVQNFGAGVDLGYSLGRFGEIRSGLWWAPGEANPELLHPDAPALDADQGEWRTRVVLDQLDSFRVPRDGYFFEADYRMALEDLGAVTDYDRLRVVAALAHSFGKQTIMGIGSVADSFGDPLPFWERFQLGGFLRLSGTPPAA
ncbi:MAG TPA: patatin-like phospholipase family protein, partial [Thermoanaerobaculia bacterium]